MHNSAIESSVEIEKSNIDKVEEKSNNWDGKNIIFHCLLHDDQEFLLKIFNDHHNSYYEEAFSLLNTRNSEGKSPLDMACILGRLNILKLLIKYGADLSSCTPSGYFPAHFAACWGQRECLERLLENGLRFDSVTKHGESPKNLALRYKHHHCAEFIDWAATKKLNSIARVLNSSWLAAALANHLIHTPKITQQRFKRVYYINESLQGQRLMPCTAELKLYFAESLREYVSLWFNEGIFSSLVCLCCKDIMNAVYLEK